MKITFDSVPYFAIEDGQAGTVWRERGNGLQDEMTTAANRLR